MDNSFIHHARKLPLFPGEFHFFVCTPEQFVEYIEKDAKENIIPEEIKECYGLSGCYTSKKDRNIFYVWIDSKEMQKPYKPIAHGLIAHEVSHAVYLILSQFHINGFAHNDDTDEIYSEYLGKLIEFIYKYI